MNSNLKKFLKNLKLNEENISMVLGALVIVIVGILVVNYFKDKRNQTTPEALNTTNNTSEVAQVGKSHTVTKGETMWSIAEDAYGSGYNWVDIKSANKLSSDKIEVGQKLEIPAATAKKPTAVKPEEKVATVETAPVTTTSTNSSYTVVKGDNLWKIAVKEYGDGYKWVAIAKANKLVNPNLIHAGNQLTLPR